MGKEHKQRRNKRQTNIKVSINTSKQASNNKTAFLTSQIRNISVGDSMEK